MHILKTIAATIVVCAITLSPAQAAKKKPVEDDLPKYADARYYPVQKINIALKPEGQMHMMIVGLTFELDDAASQAILKASEKKITAAISKAIGEQSYGKFANAKGAELVKAIALDKAQTITSPTTVKDVLIYSLFTQ